MVYHANSAVCKALSLQLQPNGGKQPTHAEKRTKHPLFPNLQAHQEGKSVPDSSQQSE